MRPLSEYKVMLSASLPSAKNNVPSQEEVIRDLETLDWRRGFMCSVKWDGIRVVKHPELGLLTRRLIRLPNLFTQRMLDNRLLDGVDGELVAGNPEDPVNYNSSQSAFMTEEGEPQFTYCTFDDQNHHDQKFTWRNRQARERGAEFRLEIGRTRAFRVWHAPQKLVKSIDQLLRFEEEAVAEGHEGIMFRDPAAPYKHGRSTWREQGLVKVKRFVTAEARVEGFDELMHNTNEQTRDERGYAKRSSHRAGMVPAGTLGCLRVVGLNGPFKGVRFGVSAGLDAKTRDEIWQNRKRYLRKIVEYKYQAASALDAPRIPTYLRFRDRRDM